MSVVVYDGINRVMYGDSRAYSGCHRPIGEKRKVFIVPEGKFEGSLLGITSSTPGNAELFRKWIYRGMPEEDLPGERDDFDVEALLVNPKGEVFHFTRACNPSGPLSGEYFAIGSGGEYAMGAHAAGASAEESARLTTKLDVMCAEPIYSIAL